MRFYKQKIFLIFFLLISITTPNLLTRAAAIDKTGAKTIIITKGIPINHHLPTLSFVSLNLGEYLDILSAEYLLGKALDSSGPVRQGNLRIEQITFEHGVIITRQYKVWSIRVFNGKTSPIVSPLIDQGGIKIGTKESSIKKFYGEPQKINQNLLGQKELIYTNGINYIIFDISKNTHKVVSFEIGLL